RREPGPIEYPLGIDPLGKAGGPKVRGVAKSGGHGKDVARTGMAEDALVVEDLHKRFGDLEVLKGVSVTAHVGDVIAMVGSSGSGKSTLLRCINLLETPDSGKVVVNGELIRMKPKKGGHA